MSKKQSAEEEEEEEEEEALHVVWCSGGWVVLVCLTVYLSVCLFTYHVARYCI